MTQRARFCRSTLSFILVLAISACSANEDGPLKVLVNSTGTSAFRGAVSQGSLAQVTLDVIDGATGATLPAAALDCNYSTSSQAICTGDQAAADVLVKLASLEIDSVTFVCSYPSGIATGMSGACIAEGVEVAYGVQIVNQPEPGLPTAVFNVFPSASGSGSISLEPVSSGSSSLSGFVQVSDALLSLTSQSWDPASRTLSLVMERTGTTESFELESEFRMPSGSFLDSACGSPSAVSSMTLVVSCAFSETPTEGYLTLRNSSGLLAFSYYVASGYAGESSTSEISDLTTLPEPNLVTLTAIEAALEAVAIQFIGAGVAPVFTPIVNNLTMETILTIGWDEEQRGKFAADILQAKGAPGGPKWDKIRDLLHHMTFGTEKPADSGIERAQFFTVGHAAANASSFIYRFKKAGTGYFAIYHLRSGQYVIVPATYPVLQSMSQVHNAVMSHPVYVLWAGVNPTGDSVAPIVIRTDVGKMLLNSAVSYTHATGNLLKAKIVGTSTTTQLDLENKEWVLTDTAKGETIAKGTLKGMTHQIVPAPPPVQP